MDAGVQRDALRRTRDLLMCELGHLLARIMVQQPQLARRCEAALYMLVHHRFDCFLPASEKIAWLALHHRLVHRSKKARRLLGTDCV